MLVTETSVLTKEAANFDRIVGELQSLAARVEAIASQMDSYWRGEAANAAKAAIARFREAARAQNQQLNDIASNIHCASSQYGSTDDERSQALASAMSSGMGGPSGSSASQSGSAVTDGARTGVQLVGLKQDGGARPPGVSQPSPGQPQIGPFPVPRQVAAAAQQLPPNLLAPTPTPTPPAPAAAPSLGQCVTTHVKETVGKGMVKGGFESAAKGALLGGMGGGAATPEFLGAGAPPGAVLGFVGGFAKGVMEAPIKAGIEGALECEGVHIPKVPLP